MKIKRGEKVADIGAGTGYLLEHLDKAVGPKGRVYALDVEQSLVDFMNERIKAEKLASSEAALIPFDSPGQLVKQADKVVVLNTWHHIQERKAYSKKLFSLLPRGGQVFIVDPEIGKGGPGPKDLHRMPPTKVAAELASGGFKCKIAEENLGHQYIVVCRKD